MEVDLDRQANRHHGGTPASPLTLGLLGLIPFWALTLMILTGLRFGFAAETLRFALGAYGATIVAFLGGIRWGVAVRASQNEGTTDFVVSVVPQLIGSAALLLAERPRFVVLAATILCLGVLDQGLVRRGLAPAWFGRLRMILSLGAGAALLVTAFTAP